MKSHTFKKITKGIIKKVAKSYKISRKKQFEKAAWLVYVAGK